MSNSAAYAALALAAGAGIPVMAVLNSSLARMTGSVWIAVAALCGTALAASLVAAIVTGSATAGVKPGAVDWRYAFAGLIFVFYIASATFLIPRFGVANTILCVVVAQVVASAMIDHFGLLGMPHKPLDALRLAGLALTAAGFTIVQLGSAR